tara:strand:- start:1251 stop:1613 length:363 start_codon:yes stop_codon:yes gene_type:complete
MLNDKLNGEERPWGRYDNLYEDDNCKVKKITIKPNQNPSYQMHFKRSEVWVVISGTGQLRLNDVYTDLTPGSVANIPLEAKHTITNTGDDDLVFIEVQMGTYFGEDDIVRLEDKYGRQGS